MDKTLSFSEAEQKIFTKLNEHFNEWNNDFVSALRAVFIYLGDRVRIEDGRITVKKDGDLFNELTRKGLEKFGITLAETETGSVYLLDELGGLSIRFKTAEGQNYYEIMNPSIRFFFERKGKMNNKASIDKNIYEEFGGNGEDEITYHKSHPIIYLYN